MKVQNMIKNSRKFINNLVVLCKLLINTYVA